MAEGKTIEEWLQSITYSDVKEIILRGAREREAELTAEETRRPLTAAEADTLRRIRDYFQIKEGRVHIKAAAALAEDVAPVPWDVWRRRGILFPKKAGRKAEMAVTELPNGERVISSSTEIGGKILTHRGFVPSDVKEKDLPRLGPLTERIYKAAIFFQKAQVRQTNNVSWPFVKKADLLRFLKYSDAEIQRGGKIFDLVDQGFQTLAFFSFEVRDKRTGKIEEVAHILDWRRDADGRGFYFKLNAEHTQVIQALIRGERAGRYVSYPQWLLREPMPDAQRGIFEQLVSWGGLVRPYPVKIKTILAEWGGMKAAEVKKLAAGAGISAFLSPVLEAAKGRGIIESWEYERKSTKSADPLSWKIQFRFQAKPRTHRVDADLLAAMLETWGQAGLFEDHADADKRRAKKRELFTAAIKKHGAAAVRQVFDETKGAEDGESAFWDVIRSNE